MGGERDPCAHRRVPSYPTPADRKAVADAARPRPGGSDRSGLAGRAMSSEPATSWACHVEGGPGRRCRSSNPLLARVLCRTTDRQPVTHAGNSGSGSTGSCRPAVLVRCGRNSAARNRTKQSAGAKPVKGAPNHSTPKGRALHEHSMNPVLAEATHAMRPRSR